MSELLVASAGALALWYFRGRMACGVSVPTAPPVVSEACRDVEHAPNNWMEALHYFKEVFKLMYTETLGRWHTVDLFVGLAYLSHKEQAQWPARDIANRGRRLNLQGTRQANMQLREELAEIRRYMLYCRGLKFKKAELQARFWIDNTGIDQSQILFQHATAGLLRPAYVLIRDDELRKVVLCVRGTQSMKDLFTSLTGATKPHHVVTAEGVTLGYSHLGMLAAARWLLRQALPQLKQALNTAGPDYALCVVGHSMGAGTAVMLTMMLRDLGPQFADTRCVAIACPACMTLELANSCKGFVTSVVNGTDIVPTFCAASVEALREDITTSSWFAEFQRDMRASVMRAVQGGVRGLGSATQWTARNILTPAAMPLAACYTRTAATCGPGTARINKVSIAASASGVAVEEEERQVEQVPFFLPAQSAAARGITPQPPTTASTQQQPLPPLPTSFAPPPVNGERMQPLTQGQPAPHRPPGRGIDAEMEGQGLRNGLSEAALEQTLRSVLYAAQKSHHQSAHASQIAAAIQLLEGAAGGGADASRQAGNSASRQGGNSVLSPVTESPLTPPSGASHVLASETDARPVGGSGLALRRRLWPWGNQTQNEEDSQVPLLGGDQQGAGAPGEEDSEYLSHRPSSGSDSRGLHKGGRDAGGTPRVGATGGWGGWMTWMGWGGGQGTPGPAASAPMSHTAHQDSGTPSSVGTPTAHASQSDRPVRGDGEFRDQEDSAAPEGTAGGHPPTGTAGATSRPVIAQSSGAGQRVPAWAGGIFKACVSPSRLRTSAPRPNALDSGPQSPLSGIHSAGEEDEELGDAELLLGGGGSDRPLEGPLRSGPGAAVAHFQQLEAGISAVVAAVTHEPEEEEGGDGARLTREAERVLQEAGEGHSMPASPASLRPTNSLRGVASEATAIGGSEGGGQLARAPSATIPWRARSRSVSGTADPGPAAGPAEGLRVRAVAAARAAAAAAADQAGMMEINVDGHLLQAPSAPGFGMGTSGTCAASGTAAGTIASNATRQTHRQLYPAGRILHFVPLHALQLDPPTPTPGHSRSTSVSSMAPVLPADMPHRLQRTPYDTVAATAVVAAAASAASRATGAATFSDVAAAAAAQGATWVLVEVEDPTAYGRVKLCRTMVMDHFVSSYLVALDSVVAQLLDHVAALDEGAALAESGSLPR